MSLMLRKIFLGLLMLCDFLLCAQFRVTGKVRSEKGEALPFANIFLKNTSLGTSVNDVGEFVIKNVNNGEYVLVIACLGFRTIEKRIVVDGHDIRVNIILEESPNDLEEVIIKVKSQSEKLRETVYKPEVVSFANAKIKSTPVIDVVGRVSGVVVRRTGGLGSNTNIMVNGISGKGIRTFVDGIPLDLLGNGFQLVNISPNIIERIEVYKGIVPVNFSLDALGGVINISTKNKYTNYLDVSLTTGSWNTQLATVGLKKYLDKDNSQFIQVEISFNHSNNDYWMYDVDVVADVLGNTKKGKARRFNDAYTSCSGRLQYGFQKVSWADEFKYMLSVSKIKNEYQHSVWSAENPWGEVYGEDTDINNIISWSKKSSDKKWNVSSLAGFNIIKRSFVDIASKSYLWDKTTFPRSTKGESGYFIEGQTPITTTNSLFFRTNIGYKLVTNHGLNFTSLTSYEKIQGEDKAGTVTLLEDVYERPQKLTKNFLGVSLVSNFLDNRLTNALSVKHFYGNSSAVTFNVDGSFDEVVDNTRSIFGYGDIFKYKISKSVSAYTGYEFAIRMPDREEIFGDVSRIAANGNLNLEESHNVNIGAMYKGGNYKLNIGSFFRKASNMIFLAAMPPGRSAYVNLLESEVQGVEMSVRATPIKNLSINANGTYQKNILTDADALGRINPRYVGEKIPNIPYLYANLGVSYIFPDFLRAKSDFTIGYENNYVHEFYPTWEIDGLSTTKAFVPMQFVHNLALNYSLSENKYGLSLECRNFTNDLAYDNFRVQKAGRSFYVKLSMYLD